MEKKILKEIWLRDSDNEWGLETEPTIKISKNQFIYFNIDILAQTVSCFKNGICSSDYFFNCFELHIDSSRISDCITTEILKPNFAIAGVDLVYENAPTEKYHLPCKLVRCCNKFNKVEVQKGCICISINVKQYNLIRK